MTNLIQANAFACQFRNKEGRKWSEWKTELWIPMVQVVKVKHPGMEPVAPGAYDDFDIGYLKAVNWQFQNEREFAGRKDIEFRFIAKYFSVYDKFKGDPITYECDYVSEEVAEVA